MTHRTGMGECAASACGSASRMLLVLVLLAASVTPGAANLRAENMALRTSLVPAAATQKMQEGAYTASQQSEMQTEEQYAAEQEAFVRQEEQEYAGEAAQALQVPAPAPSLQAQSGYAEPGQVAEPWPAASYNVGEPLVTKSTEEEAKEQFPGDPVPALSHRTGVIHDLYITTPPA